MDFDPNTAQPDTGFDPGTAQPNSGFDPSSAKPQVADDRAYAASPGEIARASLAPDTSTQIKRYADYFKQPETDFSVNGGKIIRKVPEKGTYAYVEPSLSGGKGVGDSLVRGVDWAASGIGPAIPAITGGLGTAAGAVAGAPTGPGAAVTAVAGGAAGGAGGEFIRQGLDKALAGDSSTPIDYGNVGWQAAAGAANKPIGWLAGKAAVPLARLVAKIPGLSDFIPQTTDEAGQNMLGLTDSGRKAVLDHISGQQAEMDQLSQDAKALGIDLSLGQKTDSTTIQRLERQVARTPEGADAIQDFRDNQNTNQVPNAVRSVLDNVAPAAPPGQQVGAFRDAADAVTDKAWKDLSAQARPIYKAALDDKQPFINEDLQDLLSRPTMKAAWQEAQKNAADEGRSLPQLFKDDGQGNLTLDRTVVPDWRAWQDIKKGLGNIVQDNTDQSGHFNSTALRANNLKGQMMDTLYQENPDWKAADLKYGSDRDAVDAVLDGGVGLINKMSGPDRQNIVNRVFSGQNLFPDEIARMRGQFTTAGKLDDWNSGVRSYVEDKLTTALAPTQQGDPSNVGGKLYKGLWGDKRQADTMEAALGDPATVARWQKLGNVLQAASRQLPEGSPTMTDGLQLTNIGKTLQAVKALRSPMSAVGAATDEVAGRVAALQSEQQRRKMVQYLLTDEGDRALRSLPPKAAQSPYGNIALGNLLTSAGVEPMVRPDAGQD